MTAEERARALFAKWDNSVTPHKPTAREIAAALRAAEDEARAKALEEASDLCAELAREHATHAAQMFEGDEDGLAEECKAQASAYRVAESRIRNLKGG